MKWVKCSDQLPPAEGPFLGYSPTNEDCPIYVLEFDPGVKYIGEFERCSIDPSYREASGEGWMIYDPTYWMPLPPIPDSQ